MRISVWVGSSRPVVAGRPARAALAVMLGVWLAGSWAGETAQAFVLKPELGGYVSQSSFGSAFVHASPFLDPAGQRLPLPGQPAYQAFPRGYVADSPVNDSHRVRMRVLAFGSTGQKLADYHVDALTSAQVKFDRQLNNIAPPNQIQYLRYDFCRQQGEDGAPVECEPALRLSRPPPPAPPPPPGSTTPPAPAPGSGPTDADPDREPIDEQPAGSEVPPAEIELPGAKRCIAPGEPVKIRLVPKRRRGPRVVIRKVVFFVKRGGTEEIVDRRAPFRAALRVTLPPGTRARAYARVHYRVRGRRRIFKRTIFKPFTTCPAPGSTSPRR